MLDATQSQEISATNLSALADVQKPTAKPETGTDALFQQAGVNASTQPQKVPEKSPTFSRSKFIQEEGTGVETKNFRKKELGKEQNDVQFSVEMRDYMTKLLVKHVGKLVGFTEGMTNPQTLKDFQLDLDLVKALTKDGQVDSMMVRNFLNTEVGWQTSIQLLEHQTALKIFGSGLSASVNPDSVRQYMIDPHTMYLHEDQGWLRHQLSERFFPWLKEPALKAGGRPAIKLTKGQNLLAHLVGYGTVSGLAGGIAAVGSPGGAAFVAGAEAVAGAVEGIAYSLRNGVTIDLKQCVDTFKVLKNGPAKQIAYLKEVMGIDLGDFQVNAAGTGVEVVPGGPGGRTVESLSAKIIKNEIYQGLLARVQFYKELGVPQEVLDSLPEEFLYKGLPSAEQTGSVWERRIQEKFQPNNRPVGESVEDKIRAYTKARQEVMAEIVGDYLRRVMDGGIALNDVTRWDKKIADLQNPESTLRKDLIEPENKKKEKLVKERTDLETNDLAPVTAYEQAEKDLKTAHGLFETEFEDAFNANSTPEKELERIIDLLTDESSTDPKYGIAHLTSELEKSRDTFREEQLDKAQARIDTLMGKVAVKKETAAEIETEYLASIKTRFVARETSIAERKAELETKKTRLKTIIEEIKKNEKILNEKRDPICTKAKENLSEINVHFTTLTSWGIDESELRNLTVDEIMARINAFPSATTGVWDESHNYDPDKRSMVINAIVEAKSHFEESFDPKKGDRDKFYDELTSATAASWGLTPAELRNMSRQRLIQRIHQIWIADNTKGWENTVANNTNPDNLKKLDDAMFEAKNRIVLRHNGVVRTKLADLDTQIKIQTEKINSFNYENNIDVITCIKDAMERMGKIYEGTFEVMTKSQEYFSTDVITADDDNFSSAEKVAIEGSPALKGYWRMIDVIFGYSERNDRAVYAPKIVKALPPSALSHYIRDSLTEAGITPSISIDLVDSLTDLQTAIELKMYNKFDLQTMFRNILNGDGERTGNKGLRGKANAL
jgi:hypothetical protein